jgi:hypothetical protein
MAAGKALPCSPAGLKKGCASDKAQNCSENRYIAPKERNFLKNLDGLVFM